MMWIFQSNNRNTLIVFIRWYNITAIKFKNKNVKDLTTCYMQRKAKVALWEESSSSGGYLTHLQVHCFQLLHPKPFYPRKIKCLGVYLKAYVFMYFFSNLKTNKHIFCKWLVNLQCNHMLSCSSPSSFKPMNFQTGVAHMRLHG